MRDQAMAPLEEVFHIGFPLQAPLIPKSGVRCIVSLARRLGVRKFLCPLSRSKTVVMGDLLAGG